MVGLTPAIHESTADGRTRKAVAASLVGAAESAP
jgi:hypothetical protein